MKLSPAIRVLSLVVLIFSLRETAYAQDPDVVEVANGDRIRGDVRRLERGVLSFRTASAGPGHRRFAGTISIVWLEVVRLTSSQNLNVELASGETFTGSISSPSPGQLVVQTASGPTQPIDMKEVIRITQVGAVFRARTTGSIDFGASFTQADDARSYTLDATADNRTRSYATSLTFSSWLQRRDDEDTLTRNSLEFVPRRFFSRRWFAVARFGLQEDDALDLDWRILVAGGVGRMLVQSNRMLLSVEGGLDYDGERYGGEDERDDSSELFGGVDWDYFSPAWSAETAVAATTFISLERQRARLEIDARLRRETFWDIYWSVNIFESFDSDPPGERDRSNLGVSFGLGWTF